MQDSLLTQGAHCSMTVYNLDALSNDDVAEERKEGEDGGEGRRPVDDGKRDMEDLDAVGKVPNTLPILVRMGNYNDLVSTVDQLSGELVDMALDSSGLGVEEIAHHGDVVCSTRHCGGQGVGVMMRAEYIRLYVKRTECGTESTIIGHEMDIESSVRGERPRLNMAEG